MTQERMDKCISNRDEYIWCKDVLNHSESEMSLYFHSIVGNQNYPKWVSDTIFEGEKKHCPDWLRDMIFEEIVKRKEELEKEFAEL